MLDTPALRSSVTAPVGEEVLGNTGLSPAKHRLALLQLGRTRLNELTQHYALDVADRRVPEHHADALVSSHSVDFAALLGGLKREELQSIWRRP